MIAISDLVASTSFEKGEKTRRLEQGVIGAGSRKANKHGDVKRGRGSGVSNIFIASLDHLET